MIKEISHLVFYKTDPEADQLVIKILQEHFARIVVVDKLKHICQQLVDKSSKVFLITGESMEQCLASYYRSLDAVNDYTVCEHKMVALLPRHCEEEAYKAYRSGMIDDYMVARPLYEIHRVLLICEHLSSELGITIPTKTGAINFIEQSEHYSKATQTSMNRQLMRKSAMREAFEKSLFDIDTALDNAAERIQQHQSVNLNVAKLKETLAAIRSDEIRPELLQLQQKAMDLLEQAVEHNYATEQESEIAADTPPVPSKVEHTKKDNPKQKYVFNRLYQQQINVDEVLKKQSLLPSILVVEDNAISIQLTRRILGSFNIKVDIVNTGRQAFAALTSQQYNLVLIDFHLPDTNGVYIVDQVTRGNGPNVHTPIIMLSSNNNKTVISQAIERGAKGYIIKPLYKETVKKLFERFKIPANLKGHD